MEGWNIAHTERGSNSDNCNNGKLVEMYCSEDGVISYEFNIECDFGCYNCACRDLDLPNSATTELPDFIMNDFKYFRLSENSNWDVKLEFNMTNIGKGFTDDVFSLVVTNMNNDYELKSEQYSGSYFLPNEHSAKIEIVGNIGEHFEEGINKVRINIDPLNEIKETNENNDYYVTFEITSEGQAQKVIIESKQKEVNYDTYTETAECKLNSDCNDNNACTFDVCSEYNWKCSNEVVSSGCNYNNKCVPIGTRANNQYCDIDLTMKSLKKSNNICQNNYECSTNVCVDDKCISSGLIEKIINWIEKLFS